MREYSDTYEKCDENFKSVYDTIFNDYIGLNKIELVRYDNYTEEYRINGVHRAICHFNNGECYRIETIRLF